MGFEFRQIRPRKAGFVNDSVESKNRTEQEMRLESDVTCELCLVRECTVC